MAQRPSVRSNVRPAIGPLWVDRTTTERLEKVFTAMDADGKSTSTIDRPWNYPNQACQHAPRKRSIKRNPAADVLLPARKPSKPRKSFTIEQALPRTRRPPRPRRQTAR